MTSQKHLIVETAHVDQCIVLLAGGLTTRKVLAHLDPGEWRTREIRQSIALRCLTSPVRALLEDLGKEIFDKNYCA
jgi:hypothetical protein